MKLEFFADGEPAPGGSKTAIPMYDGSGKLVTKPTATGRERPVLRYVDDAKGNVAWRKIVGIRAKNKMQHLRLSPFEGALRFSVEFVMPKGKTVERVLHTIRPDLSKMIRSTEDALTSIAWIDDAQIVEHGTMKKRYARPGEQTGAHIKIEVVEAEQLELAALGPATILKPSPPAPKPAPRAFEDSPFD